MWVRGRVGAGRGGVRVWVRVGVRVRVGVGVRLGLRITSLGALGSKLGVARNIKCYYQRWQILPKRTGSTYNLYSLFIFCRKFTSCSLDLGLGLG